VKGYIIPYKDREPRLFAKNYLTQASFFSSTRDILLTNGHNIIIMKLKRQHGIYIIGLGITIGFVFLALARFAPFERLEMLLYDLRYQLRGKAQAPPEIVIVGIDDRSLHAIGRWPWDRDKLADL
jgi:CHASE2 domain-containing sensor protein